MTEKDQANAGHQRARATAKRVCGDCQKPFPIGEDGLLVVRKVWTTSGKTPRTVRSRGVSFQCQDCAEKDPVWNKKPYVSAPGNV